MIPSICVRRSVSSFAKSSLCDTRTTATRQYVPLLEYTSEISGRSAIRSATSWTSARSTFMRMIEVTMVVTPSG